MTLDRRFATVSANLVAQDPAVEQGRMLHAPGLKISGKFFAFASRDDLYVKLPASRVKELLDSGAGRPCEIRKGSPMREWTSSTPSTRTPASPTVNEARDFVARQPRR